jgi:hypothetical protein
LINSESEGAAALQNKIEKTRSQHSHIASLLKQATKQKNSNKYTSPKNDNAFDTYNKILKSQPNNKQALDGLKNIQWHYRSQFNRHVSASQLQMQNKLKNSQQKIDAANTKKPTDKKLNIHQVSEIIGQFKASIEKHQKNKLKSLSQFMPGRELFVDQLFNQYLNIIVKVSHLQIISEENIAVTQITLTDLIDINDNKVTAGSWSKFNITVRYKNNRLKVHW